LKTKDKTLNKIIIQAGGKGSRLEALTLNKPKCLVSVNNLPIIFYLFNKFPDKEFYIIADYKIDVLKKYLGIFAKEYKYKIIKAQNEGTVSGICDALEYFSENENVLILWCDLILDEKIEFNKEINDNYIGISKKFECRWSFENNLFKKTPSKEHGVAGLYLFKNKNCLKNIPISGAFVPWLCENKIKFKEFSLEDTKEIGTLIAYDELNKNENKTRPFNKITVENNIVIKEAVNEQGIKIANDEINWYKEVKKFDYNNIPEIYEYKPLKMKKIEGKNIWEYDYLSKNQKKDILKNIIESLIKLHKLKPSVSSSIEDLSECYINKTFERINTVKSVIPFSNDKEIKINGKKYKNIFFNKDKFISQIKSYYPEKFYLIHGDCTFSNIIFDTFNLKTILIDPRGYFGKTKLYGDIDYDWAKLYYSIKGNYDQFNNKKFNLEIKEHEVNLSIKSNNWEDMEEYFFELLPNANKNKIKLLHGLIWLSLTTYVWDDYDSVCAAFYNGLTKLGEVL